MIKVCKYCNEEIEFDKPQQYAGHISGCDFNPNKKIKFENLKLKLKDKDYSHLVKSKEYVVKCQKCNKEYIVKVTLEAFEKGNYKKYCSRSCANSRSFSEESKSKRKEVLKEFYNSPSGKEIKRFQIEKSIQTKIQREAEGRIYKTTKKTQKVKICNFCKKEFLAIKKENGQWPCLCSDECYLKTKTHNAKGIKRQEYRGEVFDSGYEVKVAKWLDENNIKREKGRVVYWNDKLGKQHKYFPDFYLPDFDIYLDPKNDYCIEQQKEKLDTVVKLISLIYGSPELIIEKITTYNRSKLRT